MRLLTNVPFIVLAMLPLAVVTAHLHGGEPTGRWKLLPFKVAPAKPVVGTLDIAQASHQAPAGAPAEAIAPGQPFPLISDMPTAEELHRQTNEDMMRKSWGCINCHQGVRDMHDLPTVKLG